jgi:hypothetical protein
MVVLETAKEEEKEMGDAIPASACYGILSANNNLISLCRLDRPLFHRWLKVAISGEQ